MIEHLFIIYIISVNNLTAHLSRMERTLATVNINMGLGHNNPVLIITRSTNVPRLVGDFIAKYSLPTSAYDAIMTAI